MRWVFICALLCPGLLAETLKVRAEAGDWAFSFRVADQTVLGESPAVEHADFQAWHKGKPVSSHGHKLEFTRGAWGYTLTIQPNPKSPRITLFNHTSIGKLWFATAPDILKLRPGWYRFGEGHSLGVGGATAMVRVRGEIGKSTFESSAIFFAVLMAGLLGGAWISRLSSRPYDLPEPFPEPGICPGNANQNQA